MEKLELLSIPFYKFTGPDKLADEILQDISSKPFVAEDMPELGSVYDSYYNEKLFKFFDESVEQVKQLYFRDELSFPITDCWVNKYTTMQKLKRHKHSNSVICGLYYVTDHAKTGATIFETKNPWTYIGENDYLHMILHKPVPEIITGSISPSSNTLIIFPASLYHYMKTITVNGTIKYSIAFNTFPSGNISQIPSNKLTIKSASLKNKLGY